MRAITWSMAAPICCCIVASSGGDDIVVVDVGIGGEGVGADNAVRGACEEDVLEVPAVAALVGHVAPTGTAVFFSDALM